MEIKKLSKFERPYEKLEKYGTEHLSNAELLAIILKTGYKDFNSVDLANRLLKNNPYSYKGLRFLENISIDELVQFKGIGRVKAITLKAIGELIKRVERPLNKNVKITSTTDAVAVLMPELQYEVNEKILELLIDNKGNLLKIVKIREGDINKVDINIHNIFIHPLKHAVSRIILAHNHPTGDSKPSKHDIEFTKKVIEAGKLLEIEVLDHIVIGDNNYTSIIKEI